MSNFLRGVLPDELCELIVDHVQLSNEIRSIAPTLLSDSSSSEEDTNMPRPMFTRCYTGEQYVVDLLSGHLLRAYNSFRLSADAFHQLRELLESRSLLTHTKNILVQEQLAIFLRGIAHAHSYRQLCEFFQHSLETVSRYFNLVLRAIVSLANEFITMPTVEAECHPYNVVGAIDGTHIPAVVNKNLQNRYRNRKGFTSQNVIAAVSFDRQFVYVGSGWEGSAADMRVLRWAIEEGDFKVPAGKYFLVDSGYANTDKLIAPFRWYRYHLAEYRTDASRRYSVAQELYNHRHAQLRNVVERTFGIWKERFQVLTHMHQFPLAVQADIVLACADLHNFIGRYHGHDIYFNMSQTEMHHNSDLGEVQAIDEDPNLYAGVGERALGDGLRHLIATNIWEARVASQRSRLAE
ncbi:hypothetical protein KFK09_014343 [Dendrobium nobile]|uniref:DDE Tnp4 domain-containing protein n=1 Tax=Dendrobium nobile TaxID=94219 RepID=A0A8T3BBN1_DENNO|nr:hypothetical protein KFK09_014343 [Dendrobium nobile]